MSGDEGASERVRRWVVPSFFAVLLVVGALLFRDFGVSWDEPDYYRYGELTKDFYVDGNDAYESFSNLRFYGPAVPLLHAVVADVVDPSPADAFDLAHLVNYLIFVAAAAALYRLLLLQTGSWSWALLGSAMLVLSPRMFSHGFVNPKDGPFLALLTINIWLLVEYLERPRRWLLPVLGVVTGVLLDIRVLGLLGVGFTMVALALEAPGRDLRERLRSFLFRAWVYFGVALAVMVLMWPFLWADPVGNFADSVRVMSNFTNGPQWNVFMGELVPKITNPWYYAPVWLVVTTPVAYVALAVIGLGTSFRHDPRRLYAERSTERHMLLYAAWLVVPFAMVVVQRSPLYDEWRHLNFVYPALIIFAIIGAKRCWEWLRGRAGRPLLAAGFMAVLIASMIGVAVSMARLHPYEAVYFNEVAGGLEGAGTDYELDYWGLSYREGLEFVLDAFPQGEVDIFTCTTPGLFNAALFDDSERLRFVAEPDEAAVAICAPRGELMGVGAEAPTYATEPRLFEVRRSDTTILYVADLRETSGSS